MNEDRKTAPAVSSAFPTTHWSIIAHAGAGTESQTRAALESLCSAYWFPIYAFVRRTGRTHHEAEDCTQEFFAHLLASEGIARARQDRGRFRTFLLASMRNFLTNDWHRSRAVKRGGGVALISLDISRAGERFDDEPTSSEISPEKAYDRAWAQEMIGAATAQMRREYEAGGRGIQFDALTPFLTDDAAGESHDEAAARLGMNAHAFTVALHRLRRRLAARLRAVVSETVADPAEVDAELRHLIAALRGEAG
jgi:DNA-directed RNA polymerase specialized sigma24 family protein